ncbi:hypothetical protein BDZ89DRAFT_1037126 [Hymenopellis radicata]|nr:hypothetical protein BDZ89DRAFT_1037126 [Hymenopellis radicata]
MRSLAPRSLRDCAAWRRKFTIHDTEQRDEQPKRWTLLENFARHQNTSRTGEKTAATPFNIAALHAAAINRTEKLPAAAGDLADHQDPHPASSVSPNTPRSPTPP